MLALATLILAYSLLQIGAAGSVPSFFYATCLLVNFIAFVECVKSAKKQRLAKLGTTGIVLSSYASLGWFFLTNSNPSTSQKSYHNAVDQLILEGHNLGLWEAFDYNYTNTLSFWNSLQFLLLWLCLPSVVYLCACMKRRDKLRLTYVMLIFAFFNISMNIIDKFLYTTQGKIWGIFDIGADKSSGIFVNENHYGVFIAFFLPLITVQLIHQFKQKHKTLVIFYSFLLIYFIFGLMLSGSRGALVICAISFILTFIFIKQSNSPNAGAFKCTVITVIILLFAYFTPSQLNTEIQETGIEFGSGRQRLFSTVPEISKDFLFGTGPGAYRFVAPSYLVDPYDSNTLPLHTENVYFQFLIELGWPFCIIISLLCLSVCKLIFQNIQSGILSDRLKIASLIALSLFFCHASYDHPFDTPAYAVTLAIFLGFLLTPGEHYLETIHKAVHIKISKLLCILPLVAFLITGFIMLKYNDKFRTHPTYKFAKDATLIDLSKNLTKNPGAWHHWAFLSTKIIEKEPIKGRYLAIFCLKQAGIHNPNYSHIWLNLAQLRMRVFDSQGASRAFRHYFLLQNEPKRKQLRKISLSFFSEDEYNYLLHLEMPMQERTREYIRSI